MLRALVRATTMRSFKQRSMTSIYKVLSTGVESLTRLCLLQLDNIRVQ